MGRGDKYRRLNGFTCGGCAVSLGVKTSMLCIARSVQLKRHHDSTEFILFAVDQNEVLSFEISRNGFHGDEVAASSHRCACVGVCAFFCGESGVHSTGVLGTSACRCTRCTGVFASDISVQICDTRVCMCTRCFSERKVCACFLSN